MVNDHYNCNCYECAPYRGNHVDNIDPVDKSIVGKFISSEKPINIYKSMGGAVKKTVQPGGFVGKVHALNSKKTWIYLPEHTGGGYIPITKDLKFRSPDPIPPLTQEQKAEIAKDVIKKVTPSGEIVLKTGEVAKGVAETAKGTADTIAFIGKNLKFVLIGVIVLVVIFAYIRVKS